MPALGGMNSTDHVPPGGLTRHRPPRRVPESSVKLHEASSVEGFAGCTWKWRLKQIAPSGRPSLMFEKPSPPLVERAMLETYWFIAYSTSESVGSIATVAPSPPSTMR